MAETVMLARTCAYPNAPSVGTGPPSWQENFPPELTEERKRALLAYWRDLFAGAPAEVLLVPPVVEEAVRREFPDAVEVGDYRGACIEYAMRWFYGNYGVTHLSTPRGCVILAIGGEEEVFFHQSIPYERQKGARTTWPPSWQEVVE